MLIAFARRAFAATADEAGAVLVIFAVFASGAIGLAAYVIDVGNWFDHHRHLQLQADAGAFAGAQTLAHLINSGCTLQAKKEIYEAVARYAGATSVATPETVSKHEPPMELKVSPPTAPAQAEPYNAQAGGTPQSEIHAEVNLNKYYEQPQEDKTVVQKAPCEAGMVDVKMTETNLPWFLKLVGGLNLVPYINAHARVTLQQETSAAGLEPLPVADTAPVAVRAYFVNEDPPEKGKVLASEELEKTEVNANREDVWSIPATPGPKSKPVTLAINHPHVGVVLALSGREGHTTCGEEYVECLGRESAQKPASLESAEPVLHIAGYGETSTGTPEKPVARKVTLAGNTCPDGYFSRYEPANKPAPCTVNVSAVLNYSSSKTKGVTVTPELNGQKGAALTPPTNAESEPWTGPVTLQAGTGSNQLNLIVECKKESESPCASNTKATITDVHRIYAASMPRSGTINGAWVGVAKGATKDADSFPECGSCKQELTLTVNVAGSLADAAGYEDKRSELKFTGNKSLWVCDPAENPSTSEYKNHLAHGCSETYKLNKATAGNFEPCATEQPFNCVKNVSGEHNGAEGGIAERFISARPAGTEFYCPSKWVNNNEGGVPNLP
jgi:hypothetical protein